MAASSLLRKNINSMSANEINNYVGGLKAMKQHGSYDTFIQSHYNAMLQVHGTSSSGSWIGSPFFLPWHRAFLMDFEQRLRAEIADSSFALPYWDWTEDASLMFPSKASIWSPSIMGGNGAPVTTGPFVPSQWPTISPDKQFGPGLRRNLSPFTGFTFTTRKIVHQLFTYTKYDEFSSALEKGPHGNMHVWVGGQMGTVPNSVNDPVFWLHHANLDRIWSQWQRLYPSASVTATNFGPDSQMPPTFDTKGARQVKDVLNVVYQNYSYDTYYDIKKLRIVVETGDRLLAGTDAEVHCRLNLRLPGKPTTHASWLAELDSGHCDNKNPFERGETDTFTFDKPNFLVDLTQNIATDLATPIMFQHCNIRLRAKSDDPNHFSDWRLLRFKIEADGAVISSPLINKTLTLDASDYDLDPLPSPVF